MLKLQFVPIRAIALASTLGLAAACGGGGTGPAGLTPGEVGGVYHVCQLVFTPNNPDLYAAVDVRARTMDLRPEADQPARLFVDNSQTAFALQYMRGTFLERLDGEYRTGRQNVEFTFANPTAALSRLLIPGVLNLDFQGSPRRLEFSRLNHDVSGQDYATIRGISPEGAPPTIRGTLTGRFQVGGCG